MDPPRTQKNAPPPPKAEAPARPLASVVGSFNDSLCLLAGSLARSCPEDATIQRAFKRVTTVVDLNPIFVIGEVGPYLYKYRTQIYEAEQDLGRVAAFFFENSFDAELKEGVNQEKVDLVSYIIPRVKEHARGLTAGDRDETARIIVSLLDDYIDYLWAVATRR